MKGLKMRGLWREGGEEGNEMRQKITEGRNKCWTVAGNRRRKMREVRMKKWDVTYD